MAQEIKGYFKVGKYFNRKCECVTLFSLNSI